MRFAIEITALVGLGAGGWEVGGGLLRWVLAGGFPLVAAVVWGTFRVPGDPGPAPVTVPGRMRLVIEAAVLGGGVAGFAVAFRSGAWIVFLVIVVFHYVAGVARLHWLLER